MALRYFELLDDVYVPGRWELNDPTDQSGREVENPWMFRKGEPVQLEERLKVPLTRPGRPLDFSMAGIGVTPVIHAKVAAILAQLAPADVQLLPVDVASQSEPYFIANVTRVVRCIDDEASEEVRYWKPEDGRPEKVGKYRAVSGMRIDPTKVGATKVFRTWGWTIALIVSEDIKEALERAGVTGVKFKEVTGPSALSPEEREQNRRLLELREQTDTAREAFWRTLGRLDEEALIPIVVGGSWPARRQVWRIIHRPGGRTLLVTDGLSDFFVDRAEPSVGFGLEHRAGTSCYGASSRKATGRCAASSGARWSSDAQALESVTSASASSGPRRPRLTRSCMGHERKESPHPGGLLRPCPPRPCQ